MDNENGLLNLKSLKQQVYEYLRKQMGKGNILPGSVINLNKTAKQLGISKTPLREALIQLEMDEFVRILPRKGIVVNVLTLRDIKDFYQLIGSLERSAVLSAFAKIGREKIEEMEKLNRKMQEAIENGGFDIYYQKNLEFHNTYLNLCQNKHLVKIVNTLKKRLYDFPRQRGYLKEWEEASIKEHEKFLNFLKENNPRLAADYIRDVHWFFEVQKKFIKKYYPLKEYQKRLEETLGERYTKEAVD